MKLFDVYPLNNIAIVKAKGSNVWDDEGQKYLDMYGGHAVISIGHTAPEYVEALTNQLNNIGFYSNSVIIKEQAVLAEKFGVLSGKEDYALFMCNSGAEANENAMKLASFHTGRKQIIAFKAAFHGRTSLAVSATDNPSIIAPVNETDNIVFLPYNDTEALKSYFADNGKNVAGVIVEAIQGVGGINVASTEFLQAIRSLCDTYGAIFIADSVQDGCGRSGKYYALDHAGVDADIYSMAKGIGNGFPVGAISISPKIEAKHGMLGTTFGGNQLACAAMSAVTDVMLRDNLIDNAANIGEYLISELQGLKGIKEVRGRGLMIGIEFKEDAVELRRNLLFQEHIFVGAAGKKIVRLLPALNITKAHADEFLTAFKKLLC
ncbi:MAG: aminotransferase class III-fold pyridoxal phosphate-dependent enzyme [Rikenellaceae bacterium]